MHVWQSVKHWQGVAGSLAGVALTPVCLGKLGLLSLCLRLWLDPRPAGENLLTRCVGPNACVVLRPQTMISRRRDRGQDINATCGCQVLSLATLLCVNC